MALSRIAKWNIPIATVPIPIRVLRVRAFRSDEALDAIAKAREEKISTVVLYNYPSFSGAFSALFAHLFHSRLHLPCLILPFSPVVPFRVEDFYTQGLERCYLFDFLGPKGFAAKLLQRSTSEVIAFDHRQSPLSQISSPENCPGKLIVFADPKKSSCGAAYSYFSEKLSDSPNALLDSEDQGRVEMVLKHIEDINLRKWSLPDINAFSIGLREWRSKLNCTTNSRFFEQLLGMSSMDLIAKGNAYLSARQNAASKLLGKVFNVRLGRGLYGECLGVKADENSDLSGEIGKQLSIRSAEAGLRPIGAVLYMKRNNLKMCLRSSDPATDTSEIAKAYGGGGTPSSSSFIIRMDELNEWLCVNASS